MKVLILTAGYGTRLYPLTKDRPKPLLPVAGKLMVEHILKKLSNGVKEIDKVYFVTNEKFCEHFRRWAKTCRYPWQLQIINDHSTANENRVGAIGDIALVIKEAEICDDLLVIAGDNLFDFSISPFIRFALQKGISAGLYYVEDMELVKKYSAVEIDEQKRIIAFEEKPSSPSTHLIAICMYFFPRQSLRLLDKYIGEGNNTDEPGRYISWLSRQEDVFGYVFKGKWFDIGDMSSYERANKELQ